MRVVRGAGGGEGDFLCEGEKGSERVPGESSDARFRRVSPASCSSRLDAVVAVVSDVRVVSVTRDVT